MGHLVNFLIYSFYFISVHPLSRNGESELFVLQLQVVVDALQKAVDAGQLQRIRTSTQKMTRTRFQHVTSRVPLVSYVTGSHHASECLLYVRVLGALQHRLEQQWILCDPLMWFGLHVSKPHPLTLRVSLNPLDTQKIILIIYEEPRQMIGGSHLL